MKSTLTIIMMLLLFGCSGISRNPKIDDGVITLDKTPVRSSTAELALDVAQLGRGDEVEILERRGDKWLKIRTADGVEGWIEAYAVSRKALVEEANALADQVKHIPTQAVGRLSGPVRLRVSPGRASDENVIMTLPRGTNVQVLDRQRTLEKSQEIIPKQYQPAWRRSQRRSSAETTDAPQEYDYWYQVRLPESLLAGAGWVYASLVDLQIPSRLTPLQEEHRIIGWFEVGQVEDPEIGPAAHYLALERHRFQPIPGIDFRRVRLFFWDLGIHGYRSSIRRVYGTLPILPEKRDEAWVFNINAYDRRTGEPSEVRFLVDVRNPRRPQLRRLK